jgi:hypothetical protein
LTTNNETNKLIESVPVSSESSLRIIDADAATIRRALAKQVSDSGTPITMFQMEYSKNLTRSLPFTDYLTEVGPCVGWKNMASFQVAVGCVTWTCGDF